MFQEMLPTIHIIHLHQVFLCACKSDKVLLDLGQVTVGYSISILLGQLIWNMCNLILRSDCWAAHNTATILRMERNSRSEKVAVKVLLSPVQSCVPDLCSSVAMVINH